MHLTGEVSAKRSADDDSRPGPVERTVEVAGVAQRRVCRSQQHELQWVGVGHLLRRDLVAFPVVLKVANKAAQRRPTAEEKAVWVVVDSRVPTLRRHVRQSPTARKNQLPKLVRVGGVRQNAAHSDHGNWFVQRARRRWVLRLRAGGVAAGRTGRGRTRPLGAGRKADHRPSFVPVRRPVVHDNVDVQATNAEGVDGRSPHVAVRRLRPRQAFRRHEERNSLPINLRVRVREVDLRRNEVVLNGQQDFQQPRQPGGLQRVTNVRLDAANGNFLADGKSRTKGCGERRQFGCVADLGRRGVAFNVL